MTDKITATRRPQVPHQLDFWVELDGAPVLSGNGVAHRGKQFKPNRAYLTYAPASGQWQWRHMNVRGGALKKDGTVGALDVSAGFNETNAPEWVREIAEHFRPKQDAPLVPDQPVTVTA